MSDIFIDKTREYLINLLLEIDLSLQHQETSHSLSYWDWFALSLNKILPLYMVEMMIDKPWDWTALSCHSLLTWAFVEKYIYKPWFWPVLSSHPIVTCEIISKYPNLCWCWDELSFNKNITWGFVRTFWFKPWDWNALSSHIDVDLETISENGFFKWSWGDLCFNAHFIRRVVDTIIELRMLQKQNEDRFMTHPESIRFTHLSNLWSFIESNLTRMHWSFISKHPCVTLDMIEKTPDAPWDLHAFLYNPNITLAQAERVCELSSSSSSFPSSSHLNLSKLYNSLGPISLVPLSTSLSQNENISLEAIIDILERDSLMNMSDTINTIDILIIPRPFDIWELTRRHDMTIEILERILRLGGDAYICVCWPALSRNKNFTWPIILANIYMPWCWFNLSMNPSITLDVVYQNPEMPWDWSGLSCNPNLSLRKVRDHITRDGTRNVLNPLLLSSHIDLSKIDSIDKERILTLSLDSQSGNVCKILAERQIKKNADKRLEMAISCFLS